MADPQPAGSQHSNLALRVMATLVLAPLAIAAAWFGGWPWHALVTLVGVGLFLEWAAIVGFKNDKRMLIAGSIAVIALSATLMFRPVFAMPVAIAGLAVVVARAPSALRGWAASGFVYAAAAMVASVLLRWDVQFGFPALVFVFAVVWASDILGYFVGRFVGGPKLWLRISPKKTWSGAIGGLLGAIVATYAVAVLIIGTNAPLLLVALGGVLSILSQGGDLFESAVKRRFDVKDSSQIIPGHGGLMDRLDGFIFVVVAACIIGLSRAGTGAAAHGLLIW
jgi:phosphatidate cytidylyltransferase